MQTNTQGADRGGGGAVHIYGVGGGVEVPLKGQRATIGQKKEQTWAVVQGGVRSCVRLWERIGRGWEGSVSWAAARRTIVLQHHLHC